MCIRDRKGTVGYHSFVEELRDAEKASKRPKTVDTIVDTTKEVEFDVEKCTRYKDTLVGALRGIQDELQRCFQEFPIDEAPPVVVDKPLKKLIDGFVQRTESFENFGGHETGGLSQFVQNLVAKFGAELQDKFGTLGMIPADLVPHSLLARVREETRSKEV
eukprot:TRINITY_DN43770_c0_g1_i1.p2 TRINITY_DN43770_c0_g1~~TRINITY_DN43770_c0_g1_i1.p2  ORF type:complete len:161 (+),score=37.55 TRINITY_DN43770_c0_g1_i1:123-605(+)